MSLPLLGVVVVHVWWLPKHGVNLWVGEPKERYYVLIGAKTNSASAVGEEGDLR